MQMRVVVSGGVCGHRNGSSVSIGEFFDQLRDC
jgi:hypothetical protein